MTNLNEKLNTIGLHCLSLALQAIRDGRQPNIEAAEHEMAAHFDVLLKAQEVLSVLKAGTLTRAEVHELVTDEVIPSTQRTGEGPCGLS